MSLSKAILESPLSFRRHARGVAALVMVCVFASVATAQWVTFANETASRLSAATGLGATDPQEKDYATADLDQDGDIDLVCVRKQPFTSPGRFPNVLFMNVAGVLTDQTTLYASASSVAGSQGFLDLTNDRDVVVTDVNGDGWLDLVTATTLSGTFPKYISHPRVYINLGNNGMGQWLGFLFDDENRIPTMPAEPRFCSVKAGDIDGDGDVDLYMGDYQQGGARPIDVNDRLFINNGNGYFTDESSLRMTVEMLESSFAMEVDIIDINGDGRLDIVKDDALNAPQAVSVSYNGNASVPGEVHGFYNYPNHYQLAYQITAYNFEFGDLNNDGILDMIISDDGQDRYQFGQTVDSEGRRLWTPAIAFSYSGGGNDDGFAGNNIIADLDNDGWCEALIADVDVDIAGTNRRLHIFRNLANAPNVTMQEQTVGGAVASIPTAQLMGTFDVAAFDINGDGFKDLVIGRAAGTSVWMNQPPVGLSFSGSLNAFVAPAAPVVITRTITPIGGTVVVPASVMLHWRINGGAYAAAPMAAIGMNQYSVSLGQSLACFDTLEYYLTVNTVANGSFSDPSTAPANVHSSLGATGTQMALEEHFEGVGTPAGWQVVNAPALTSGGWVVAVPAVSVNGGQIANPGTDAESGAQFTQCFVTGNATTANANSPGLADVDGGPTDLLSPILNLAGSDADITYQRWFYTSTTGTPDSLVVDVTNDLVNWVNVETVTGLQNTWQSRTFNVRSLVVPTATVRVRFRVADLPNNSITEAGIDFFQVQQYICTVCQPEIGLQGPGSMHLSFCSNGAFASGNTGDLVVTGTQPFNTIYIIADAFLFPTPFFGGTAIHFNPALIFAIVADGTGEASILGAPGGGGPYIIYAQAVEVAAYGIGFSNAIEIHGMP